MNDASLLLESKQYLSTLEQFEKTDFANVETYSMWLAQTYYFVRHSVRLSALGAAALSVDDDLQKRMIAHTTEEMGHHTVAERDLSHLGKNVSEYPELGLTKVFYQSQYYKVLFEHPAHLLGQILVLEAVAVSLGDWMYDLVKDQYGESATKFVKIHAQEDKNHVKRAMMAVNALDEKKQAGIKENFDQACEVYSILLQKIGEFGQARIKTDAA